MLDYPRHLSYICCRNEVFTAHSNLLLVTVGPKECPRLRLHLPNTSLCTETILLVEIQIENTPLAEFKCLKNQISLAG